VDRVLYVACVDNSQCNAVATLIQDPANVLKVLHVSLESGQLGYEDWRRFAEQSLRAITTSLVGNTHLEHLFISVLSNQHCSLDSIDKLLCDVSSIESIRSNSNHTLENITFGGIDRKLLTLAEQCLQLNWKENKATVVRKKILRFYFVGEFDVSPFVNVPVSFLPKIMGQIEGQDKQSAAYRLLKCIPELCNVSDRVT
jgi:hypothetical protein